MNYRRVWAGSLQHGEDQQFHDIALHATEGVSAPAINTQRLEYLDKVFLARVPLYIAAGPCLCLETSSNELRSYLNQELLEEAQSPSNDDSAQNHPHWYQTGQIQSNIGFLYKVCNDSRQHDSESTPRITELLVYGAISPKSDLPTPPSSSPHDEDVSEQPSRQNQQDIVLLALPLSSDLLYSASAYQRPSKRTGGISHFLHPSNPQAEAGASTKKHSLLSGLFDEAAQHRKRARHEGAKSISLAASRSLHSPNLAPLRTFDDRRVKLEDDFDRYVSVGKSRPSSSSRGSLLARPASASENVSSNPFLDDSNDARNKQMISRIVMAGMRMYGLKQTKMKSKVPETRESGSLPGELRRDAGYQEIPGADEDEFKQVYHQAYKGTLFAFRNRIQEEVFSSDGIREVVDRLLSIFCNDPP